MKRSPLLRIVAYARPYVALLALGMALSTLYSGARMARTYLLKPLIDDVLPSATTRSGDEAPSLAWPGFERIFERAIPALLSPGEAVAQVRRAASDAAARAGVELAPAPEEAPTPASVGQDLSVADRFWGLLVAGALVVLVLPITHFGKDYFTEWALGRALVDIQQEMAAKLLALPLRFHQALRRGDAITRTLSDGLRAHETLRILLSDVVEAALAVGTSLITLFLISWRLTLLALLVAPLLIAVVAIFGRRIRFTARRRQEATTDVIQRLVQILSGIKVIKAFRAEALERDAFRRDNLRLFRRGMRAVKNRIWSRSAVEGLTNVAGMVLLGLGTWLALRGAWGLTPGSLAAFLTVMLTTQRTTRDLTKAWTHLQDVLPSAERYFELRDREGEAPDPPDAVHLTGIRQGIRLSKLGFSYDRGPVLRDVSLDVRAGEVVALVGRTGAGKTTLADLLLRFYEPSAGTIEIDGIDLRRIARDSLLEHVAVVTQESFLFEGTIRDNIRYGRRGASEAEIEAAACAAHVDEFVRTLPEGMETSVGEGGAKLSGGQRQRITIARALLKNPALLIFDEATSSLDAQSERLVQDAVDRLLRDRTVILIAHRLATVRNADKIVVLEDGRVSQLGTHDELMAEPGLYRDLVRLQRIGEEPA